MVLTGRLPQKTRPTGVPTLSNQARVRAEHWRVQCLSVWTKLEIDLSQTDHFFGRLSVQLKFFVPAKC